jgi:phage-related baseplate assembly protein
MVMQTSLPEPDFIARDPAAITAEIVAQYQELSGKTLYPAQVERLLVDVIAYRETLVRIGIQEAAKQNLVRFARAPMLDYLGELVGVVRLPAQPATTTLRFAVDTPLATNLAIPAGTQVEGGGEATFATDFAALLPAGALYVDVLATAVAPGAEGNGWALGQINALLDNLAADEVTATNVTVTANGVAEEDDDRLRERIMLAPEAFSTAGSRLAYVFWAKSAHQSITDVAVLRTAPGEVTVYPLTAAGPADAALIAQVEAACSDERVRPLTDNVLVVPPAEVEYTLDARLTRYEDADEETVLMRAQRAIEAFVAGLREQLGQDVVRTQIERALGVAGVYDVELLAPAANVVIEAHQLARCTDINIEVSGAAHG